MAYSLTAAASVLAVDRADLHRGLSVVRRDSLLLHRLKPAAYWRLADVEIFVSDVGEDDRKDFDEVIITSIGEYS